MSPALGAVAVMAALTGPSATAAGTVVERGRWGAVFAPAARDGEGGRLGRRADGRGAEGVEGHREERRDLEELRPMQAGRRFDAVVFGVMEKG